MIDGLEIFQPDRWEDFRGDIYTTWDTENYPNLNWRLDKFSNRKQVLVPPGCGNAHFVLSDDCTFHYKLAYDGNYVDIDGQFVIKWDDKDWNFEWPHNNPILFGRDN